MRDETATGFTRKRASRHWENGSAAFGFNLPAGGTGKLLRYQQAAFRRGRSEQLRLSYLFWSKGTRHPFAPAVEVNGFPPGTEFQIPSFNRPHELGATLVPSGEGYNPAPM